MNELFHINTESAETLLQSKQRISYLSVSSLILSVLSIPVMYLSLHKIETVHHRALYICIIVSETPVYTVVHNLCSILPMVSIIFGILALIRIAHNRGKLCGKFLALAGLVISVVSLVVYWRLLVQFTSRLLPLSKHIFLPA
jgi:hypothetical protein